MPDSDRLVHGLDGSKRWKVRRILVPVARVLGVSVIFGFVASLAVPMPAGTSDASTGWAGVAAAAVQTPEASATTASESDREGDEDDETEATSIETEKDGESETDPASTAADDLADELLTPLRVYLLIDESGSLTSEDVAREIEVAAAVPATLFPESTVTIWGFGSAPAAGNQAVSRYCTNERITTKGAAADRARIGACALKVHRRAPTEGNDTDYHAALAAVRDEERNLAKSKPASKPGEEPPAIVLFLTDGRLDVHTVPEYGTDEAARDKEAQRRIDTDVLPAFKELGIQLWPFGYGEVDKTALDALASGGFGPNPACATSSQPVATVAGSREAVVASVLSVFRAARCAAGPKSSSGPTEVAIGSKDFPIDIPVTATGASIVVVKGTPDATVTFIDPLGRDVTTKKSVDGQTLEATSSDLESSIRITLPQPGRWIARVKTPAAATFLADATWVGRVTTNLDTEPFSPQPGEEVVVQFRLNTRAKAGALKGMADDLKFKASVQIGDDEPQALVVHDDGKSGDRAAGDLEYTGTFKMPTKCPKEVPIQVVGTVDAIGLEGDVRPKFIVCLETERALVVTVGRTPTKPMRVLSGESLEFEVSVSNDGEPIELQMGIETSPTANISVTPKALKAPSGSSTSTHKIVVGEVKGPARTDVVVRVRQDGKVVEEETFQVDLDVPPPFCEKFPCVPMAVAIVTVVAGVIGFMVFRKSQYAKAQQMRGLVARTRERTPSDYAMAGDGPMARPPAAAATEWRFVVDHGEIVRPADASDDSGVWVVKRGEKGQVRSHIRVRRPIGDGGSEFTAHVGAEAPAPSLSDDPWATSPVSVVTSDESEPAVVGDWEIYALPATFQVDDEFDLVISNASTRAK